ncbi:MULTISPECIES: major capsid protein [unclassified Pasteurella]|uniref:major capsid protein n=1 Tax=unclassified Pasteurella TaxID=2621516 RepID=UPI00107464F7|nr:hypothetical protein [Pasteurella sp. 19428wF3_WM03]TFU52410.1 hypothetical protein E4T92_02650 [Pasteurella sp. WM03]
MSKLIKKSLVVLGTLLVGSTAFAVDFSQMTSSVDFSSAVTAVLSIGGALAGVHLAIAGARAVLRMIK